MVIPLKIVGNGDAEDLGVLKHGQIFAINNHNWIEAVFVLLKSILISLQLVESPAVGIVMQEI